MQTKSESIQLLLVMAVQNALPDLGESFEAVAYQHGNAAVAALTTITKLKMLEVVAAQAMCTVMGMTPFDAGRVLTDVGKNAVIQMVAAKVLTADTAKAMFKQYAIDDVFDKAAAGPTPDAKAYSEAVATLSDALNKVAEARGT